MKWERNSLIKRTFKKNELAVDMLAFLRSKAAT
jgi:hypothetical protein